ncbi:MAG: CBS domain-containing protein [Deltaproteobacteria bacterium]|nr:CBS domain-containing protein [Deltaproteobacteria bacterium]
MLVRDWMHKDATTVDVGTSMSEVARIMKEKSVLMVPVTDGGRLTGVVTDRDMKRASASDASTLDVHELLYLLNRIKISEIMSKNPVTLSPTQTVEEAARLFLENNISGAPVVDRGRVVGVITQKEIFKVIISLTGVGGKGIQFAFLIDDRPGSIREVTDVIRKFGGRMVSILTTYDRAPQGKRFAYIRMHAVDETRLETLKNELGKKATLLYMIDQATGRRDIFQGD